jgi:pilus assembly protein CpaB
MQYDRRFILVVSLSLFCALLVAGGFYKLARGAGGRSVAAAEKQIVVATRELPSGITIDSSCVKLRGVPKNMVPSGAFTRLEEVVDRPVISAIQADEPVVEARVAVKGSGMGLGPLIPPGMRAISVRVNDVVGVAGFVLPGMRVDVLVTGKPPDRGDTETRTVLQNITVLSAGQSIAVDGKSQPIVAPVVTLLVSPAEAEALTLSNVEGHIQLLLRNSSDRAMVPTNGRRLHDLYGGSPVPPEIAPPKVQRAPRNITPAAVPPPVSAATAAATALSPQPKPVVEPERMIVIRGAVKKVEVFTREPETK